MRPEVAHRRIESFGKRFGEAHLYLAYHAAFPLALTPDLLYRLWANFQRDIHGRELGIPWIAVADLLLSSLCDEVGYELYEMDVAVRNALLSSLKEDENFGQQRINELSDFLLNYVQQQLHSPDPDLRDFAQAQQWTALAYTQPSKAARELATVLSGAYEKDRTDLVRLASLVETLAEPLAEFEPLLTYARKMRSVARGNQEATQTQFDKLREQVIGLSTKKNVRQPLIFIRAIGLLLVCRGLWYLLRPVTDIPMCIQSLLEPPSTAKASGIDVFGGSGAVDWSVVKKSGKSFAFVRATEGSSIKDEAFSRHWSAMKQAGIIRGAYHFFHPGTSDPVKQADDFLKTIGKLESTDLPPVLDVELTDDQDRSTVIKNMKLWLTEVEKGTGRKPIIYTFPSFWIDKLGNPKDFAEYPLFIAHFDVDTPTVPSAWKTWTFHSYAGDVAGVPGVQGTADSDKFNGSEHNLQCRLYLQQLHLRFRLSPSPW